MRLQSDIESILSQWRTSRRALSDLYRATGLFARHYQNLPGHDYVTNILEFSLDWEPDNQRARSLLTELSDQDPARALVTTLGLEKQINTFFRLQNPSVISNLRERFPDLPEQPDAQAVFLKLRELRNTW